MWNCPGRRPGELWEGKRTELGQSGPGISIKNESRATHGRTIERRLSAPARNRGL